MSIDTARMNDLIRWCQCQVKEAWEWNSWDSVCQAHCSACVVHLFEGITGDVEMFFGPNNVHLFSVVECFANEWNIL